MSASFRFVAVFSVAATLVPSLASARSFAAPPPSAPVADAPMTLEIPALDRRRVIAALTTARAINFTNFRAYVSGGEYPSNTFARGETNVWRDDAGHFCAAATIIAASGQGDLVLETADRDNFIRLRNVTAGPLQDWILTSGFTVDEIDQIQVPFMPSVREKLPAAPIPGATSIAVDRKLKAAETARLKKLYAVVDRQLVRGAKASLELAADRLMANPMLAVATFGLDAIGVRPAKTL